MSQHILLPDMAIQVPGRRISRVLGGGGGIMPVLGQAGGKLVILDTFDTLDPAWTWLLGTGAVSGGALRAATLTVDGYNLTTNPEFTTSIDSWSAASEATLTRVDCTNAPDIDPTGGADEFALSVLCTGTALAQAYQYITVLIPELFYTATVRAYAPSANAQLNATRLVFSASVQIGSAEDVWQTLTATKLATGTHGVYLMCRGANAGDAVFFDRVWVQASAALAYHTGFAKTDGTFTAGMPMPATATTPRSLAFRITDAWNWWEVRVLPNTAGNDCTIIEHVAGVQTTRGTPADVDWTAGAVDEIMVDVRGDDISVSHKKSGAGSWTAATSYLTMATGLAADKHGVDLYQTGVDQLTYWQAAA